MFSSNRLWFCATLAIVLPAINASAWAQRPRTVQSDAQQAAEEKILERLKGHVGGNFREEPLQQVLDRLAQVADVVIRIDTKALEDASIGPDAPVTFDTAKVTLRAALSSMLRPLDLTWIVMDEAILVTTPEKAGNVMITKIYPVYDLVTAGHANRRFNGYEPLMDLLKTNLAPTTWDEVGGPGSIHEFRASGALVVSQTFEVHEEIGLLLNVLRRVRDDQHIAHKDPAGRPGGSRLPAKARTSPPERQPAASVTVLLTPSVYD